MVLNTTLNDTAENPHICNTIRQTESLEQFVYCLKYFLDQSVESEILFSFKALFVVLTGLANLAVFILITRNKAKKSVFDLIFRAHTVPDLIVGTVVVPSYILYTTFGYWPLGKIPCMIYASCDYAIAHLGILHMMYLGYARIRSLVSPKGYKSEILIKHTHKVIACLWITSSLIWTPAINIILNETYAPGDCYFNYDWYYTLIMDVVAYLLPMAVLIGFTIKILISIWSSSQRKKKMVARTNQNNTFTDISKTLETATRTQTKEDKPVKDGNCIYRLLSMIHVSGSVKLVIIIVSFLILWLPFCIMWLVNSICISCVNDTLYIIGYWGTYIQSLANPIWIMILNPSLFR